MNQLPHDPPARTLSLTLAREAIRTAELACKRLWESHRDGATYLVSGSRPDVVAALVAAGFDVAGGES